MLILLRIVPLILLRVVLLSYLQYELHAEKSIMASLSLLQITTLGLNCAHNVKNNFEKYGGFQYQALMKYQKLPTWKTPLAPL